MTQTASTTQTRTVKSSELQVGDIVRAHGMRVRIDETQVHEDSNSYGGVFHAHLGTVLNLDEVLANDWVPASFMRTEKYVDGQGWVIDRRDAWTIQGNDLASWTVEVPVKPLLDGLSKVELSRLVTILSKAQVDMERSSLAGSDAYTDICDVKGAACTTWKSAPEGPCYEADEFALRMFVAGYFEEI